MKCDVCGHEHFRMFTNTKIKLDFYECLNCYARVGKHKNRDMAFGKFADAETRKLRIEAHKHFDALWKQKKMSRNTAYLLLAKHLGIHESQCHISTITKEQLVETIKFAKKVARKKVKRSNKPYYIKGKLQKWITETSI